MRFPFSAFPSGWFRVADSNELAVGSRKSLHYFGKDLILFRTEKGSVHLCDAYVSNSGCIKVSDRSYPINEEYGLILAYYDAQQQSPAWEIPPLPHWNDKDWSTFQRRVWQIQTHVQDMAENVVDTAHMLWLHGQSFQEITASQLEIQEATLTHRLQFQYRLALLGKWGMDAPSSTDIYCHGLGCQVSYTRVDAMIGFESLALFLLTPVNETVVEVHVRVSTKQILHPLFTRFLRSQSMTEISTNLEQDIPIWEHKMYRSQPLYSERDGPIPAYRRWTQQFYETSGPRFDRTLSEVNDKNQRDFVNKAGTLE